jgi:hypothetical protein
MSNCVQRFPQVLACWKWHAASLIVPAVAVLGFWLLKPSHPRLTLSATDMGGQLRIAWDGADRSIGHAKSGSIDIDDHGVRTQVNLTPADLRSGSLFYERQSGDVAVRLTVDVPGSPPVVETTRFLRPGQSATAPAPPPPQAPRPETLPPSLRPPAPAKSARRVIPFRAPNNRTVRRRRWIFRDLGHHHANAVRAAGRPVWPQRLLRNQQRISGQFIGL